MAHTESRAVSDEIAKCRPRSTLAYIAVSAVLWSAVIVLAVRALYWFSQV